MMQNKKQKLILFSIAAIFLIIVLSQRLVLGTQEDDFAYITEEPAITNSNEQDNRIPTGNTSEIIVHVAGAVEKPGVYTLQQGQRVEDALQAAGSTPDADIDALNRAAVLNDGQKIVVPFQNEADQLITTQVDDGLISLNQADLQQLMTLPGIGEVKAQAIIDYRTQHGAFSAIEEVKQVSGIGEAIFGQIKNKIKI